MPPRATRRDCVATLLVLTACSSEAESPGAWCDAGSPDATIVFTGAGDAGVWTNDGLPEPRFTELWRAGGLNEGEELTFPLSASVSKNGQLAVADFGLSELTIIGPDGAWGEPSARSGQGPGELGAPVAAAWSPDGADVAVFDIANSKIVYVGVGESPREDLPVPTSMTGPAVASGELAWAGVTPAGSALLRPAASVDASNRSPTRESAPAHSVVLRSLPGLDSFDTIGSTTVPTIGGGRPYGDRNAPGWPMLAVATGRSGEIAIGGEDARYRIRILSRDGAHRSTLCRDAPPLPIDRPEKLGRSEEEPPTGLEEAIAAAPRPDSLAPYGRLFFSHEGNLWVQRERPTGLSFGEEYHGVPGAQYDVFDPTGVFLGTVRAPAKARLQAALGDTVWAYEVGELDETWIVAYQLEHGAP